ncbi:hypothetical protein COLU111180_07435 [Cohnella lubricantis]|nr:hypothetical protein [Cohnella lubricantis]
MSKSKRLMELMLTVNRKRRFKVRELADEFGVSARTIMRDLQELSELGVPLYAEPGPHGGYQVVRERVLPPIAFTEEEAVAMFFAVHALRHYVSLPFETESSSALNKFYLHLPGDLRDRIDSMKDRVDFITPPWKREAPLLPVLLDAAIYGKTLAIEYESAASAPAVRFGRSASMRTAGCGTALPTASAARITACSAATEFWRRARSRQAVRPSRWRRIGSSTSATGAPSRRPMRRKRVTTPSSSGQS